MMLLKGSRARNSFNIILNMCCSVCFILVVSASVHSDNSTAATELYDAHGEEVDSARFEEVAGEVKISLDLYGLSPGLHGIHIHSVGRCQRPDFESSGGHFNPDGKKHGLKNPEGPHGGDLPNVLIGSEGTARVEMTNPFVTLGKGKNSLFHRRGTSLVIHAYPDDEKTDPDGGAGPAIACGIISK